MSTRQQRLTGFVSIGLGVLFFVVTLVLLFGRYSYLPLPTIVIGLGSIISVIVLIFALSRPH
jgi:hypothetical protein